MTDEEWQLVFLDADALHRHLYGKVSERKLRLLSAAAGRAVWDWLGDERSRSGVILLEQLADGLVSPEERGPAEAAARTAADEAELRWDGAETREQVVEFGVRWWAANAVLEGLGDNAWWASREAVACDDRAFDSMPVLGDALEEAGCRDRSVLDHCRGPEPHVRGCWLIDLLLGKE